MFSRFYSLLLVVFWLTFFSISAFSQTINFDDYSPLISSGKLPDEFSLTSSEKYEQSKKAISKKDRRFERRAKKEFLLKSTFGIDELLSSGRVLYNDPVGKYVGKVFDNVVKSAGLEEENLKVFVVKTNISNAFATDQGLIFITTGLLAHLQNEAQLAFVLSHELVHYDKKHSMDVYVTAKRTDASRKASSFDLEPAILAKAAYSKEKETEADAEGWTIFSKTGYDPNAALSSFDVLLYAHLPFDSLEFDGSSLGNNLFYWPKSMKIEQPVPLFSDADEDDELSTHPNINKRKAALDKLVKGTGKAFIVSEQEFNTSRLACRYEYCRNALLNRQYVDALYAALCLQKEQPNSIYLKKIIAKSLYGLSAYYNQGYKKDLKINIDKKQGQLQQAYMFFDKMHAYELNTLALNYLWLAHQQYPNDVELTAMLNDCGFWQAYLHYPDLKKLENIAADSLTIDSTWAYSLPISTLKDSSKNIDKNKVAFNDSVKKAYNSVVEADASKRILRLRKTFALLLSDKSFSSFYAEKMAQADKERDYVVGVIEEEDISDYMPTITHFKGVENNDFVKDCYQYFGVKKWDKAQLKKKIKRQYSGRYNSSLKNTTGEKVLFLNPEFYVTDFRKKQAWRPEQSEKRLPTFINQVKESAQAADLPFEMLSETDLSVDGAELLNQIVLLKEWLGDALLHDDVQLISSEYNRLNELSAQLNSRYLMFTYNLFTIQKKRAMFIPILYSIVAPVISWPLTFPYMFRRKMETSFFVVTFDLKNGKLVDSHFSTIYTKNSEDITLSSLYYFMMKTKLYQKTNP